MEENIELGAAELTITLSKGIITVKGFEGVELHKFKAKYGSWFKIFDTILEVEKESQKAFPDDQI